MNGWFDRLLASPRYGERWGRHWLDVVHYADTHGYDKDKRRDHAWPYRDYVIRSLNEDISYSRFIREQVAGDVIEPGDPRGVIATGFIAAGPWDFVGHVELGEHTVEKKKTRLIDRDDMLSNTMSTFVSLTVHCARCHDHKFDPILQRDYYRLQAVFAGVNRGDRPYDTREAERHRSSLENQSPRGCRTSRGDRAEDRRDSESGSCPAGCSDQGGASGAGRRPASARPVAQPEQRVSLGDPSHAAGHGVGPGGPGPSGADRGNPAGPRPAGRLPGHPGIRLPASLPRRGVG